MVDRFDWGANGFASPPELRLSGGAGVTLYRCWGARSAGAGSSEWGKGFFSLEKPRSVSEAELRFNIVDWNNGVNFVTTFRLRPGFAYWVGAVAHGACDARLPGRQVYIEPPLLVKIGLVGAAEALRHDVFVGPKDGNA